MSRALRKVAPSSVRAFRLSISQNKVAYGMTLGSTGNGIFRACAVLPAARTNGLGSCADGSLRAKDVQRQMSQFRDRQVVPAEDVALPGDATLEGQNGALGDVIDVDDAGAALAHQHRITPREVDRGSPPYSVRCRSVRTPRSG